MSQRAERNSKCEQPIEDQNDDNQDKYKDKCYTKYIECKPEQSLNRYLICNASKKINLVIQM